MNGELLIDAVSSVRPMIGRRGLLRNGGLLAGAFALGLPGRGWARVADPSTGIAGQWPAVTQLLEGAVADHSLPGAMAAFGWGTAAPQFIARGTLGPDNPAPLTGDSLFRMYSMTKPLTGMIAMMLIDEGKLGLDQPLAEIFPAFAHMQVAVDPMKGLNAAPAKAAITMRHLMTHSSGLCYPGIGEDAVSHALMAQGVALGRVSRQPQVAGAVPPVGPEAFLRLAAAAPLLFEPGTQWSYSMGLDVLGLVIEHVEGKPLDVVMGERLFGPLGMTSSYFTVPADQAHRLTSDLVLKDGHPAVVDPGVNSIYVTPPAFAFGGAGLVSSPADYDRFLAMIVGGGAWNGTRVMSARAVALGVSNLLPPAVDTARTWIAGWGFGAGGKVGLMRHAGTYGWSGLAGTVGFVQTLLGLRAGLYIQMVPSSDSPLPKAFPDAVRSDLLARPPADGGA